jgi:RNA polymerase sigma factor (sigma-70 family)
MKDDVCDQLILDNLTLARGLAKQFRSPLVSREDLVQEAMLGLTRAARAYDDRLGVEFRSFAHRWICCALMRAIAVAGEQLDRADNFDVAQITDRQSGEELFDDIQDAIECLPTEAQPVILSMFGLDGSAPRSRRWVAHSTGLSEKQVRRSKCRSLRKLAQLLRA